MGGNTLGVTEEQLSENYYYAVNKAMTVSVFISV